MAATWLRRKEYISIEDEMKHIDAIDVDLIRSCADQYPLRPKVVSIAVGEEVELD
jgi:hypothetical protein